MYRRSDVKQMAYRLIASSIDRLLPYGEHRSDSMASACIQARLSSDEEEYIYGIIRKEIEKILKKCPDLAETPAIRNWEKALTNED